MAWKFLYFIRAQHQVQQYLNISLYSKKKDILISVAAMVAISDVLRKQEPTPSAGLFF